MKPAPLLPSWPCTACAWSCPSTPAGNQMTRLQRSSISGPPFHLPGKPSKLQGDCAWIVTVKLEIYKHSCAGRNDTSLLDKSMPDRAHAMQVIRIWIQTCSHHLIGLRCMRSSTLIFTALGQSESDVGLSLLLFALYSGVSVPVVAGAPCDWRVSRSSCVQAQ